MTSRANAAPARFAAVLLAGGRSTRMDCDKAFLPVDCGSDPEGARLLLPLWQAQVGKLYLLKPKRLLISARAEQGFADRICEMPECVELLEDPPADATGPLGAVARCLEHVAMPVIVLAVDMPMMTADFLRALIASARHDRGLVPRTARAFEPLAALYVPGMLPHLRAGLAAGDYSLQHALAPAVRAGCCDELAVTPAQEPLFQNVNTPRDRECLPIHEGGA